MPPALTEKCLPTRVSRGEREERRLDEALEAWLGWDPALQIAPRTAQPDALLASCFRQVILINRSIEAHDTVSNVALRLTPGRAHTECGRSPSSPSAIWMPIQWRGQSHETTTT